MEAFSCRAVISGTGMVLFYILSQNTFSFAIFFINILTSRYRKLSKDYVILLHDCFIMIYIGDTVSYIIIYGPSID